MPNVFHHVRFRVLAAITAIIVLSLISSGGALFVLARFQTSFADIAGPRLVGLIAAAKLIKASESIVAHAPNFAAATTQTMRETVVDQLEDRISLLDESLLRVREAGADPDQIGRLQRDAGNFIDVLRSLDRLVQDRITFDVECRRLLAQILEIVRNLDTERVATQDSGGASDEEIPPAWLTAVNRSIAVMLRTAGVEDRFQLTKLQNEFIAVWRRVEELLPASASRDTLLTRDELRRIGLDEKNIFTMKAGQLRAETSIQGTLAVGRREASRLVASASDAYRDFEQRIQQENAAFGSSIFYYLLFFVGLASAAGALGATIFVYIDRGVIRRLKALQEFMRARIDERPMPLQTVGHDEIAEMARATAFFVAEIGRREDLLNRMFEAAPIPMTLVRLRDGQIVRANGRAVSQFGLASRTEGNAGLIYRGELDRATFLQELERDGFVDGREASLVRASGDPYWAMLTAQRIRIDGQTCVLVGATDISLLKEAADAQRIAKERAEEAVSAKSRFLASISHELRTPLNAIIGLTEMLCDSAPHFGTQRAVEPLSRVLKAARHLLHLINDILDLSKMDAGKMTLVLENVPIRPLLDEVVSTVKLLAEQNGTQIVVDSPPGLMTVSDRMRLKQILFNLLGNAAKFTTDGKITLKVEPRASEDMPWITFEVRDTGIGISEEHLSRLFEEFSQADATTARLYGGTGLGLVISERMCRLMGGKLTATSRLGEGSSFLVTLPADGPVMAGWAVMASGA